MTGHPNHHTHRINQEPAEMKNTTTVLWFATLLAAATLCAAPRAGAQTKHERKTVIRVLSIADGDTTYTDHEVDPEDGDFTWIDDDGNEVTAVFEADDDRDADMKEDMTVEVLGADKHKAYLAGPGGEMKLFVRKRGADGHRKMDCCSGGSCCRMDHPGMKRMHEKMKWRDRNDRDDDDKAGDDDEDSDSDDDDGGPSL